MQMPIDSPSVLVVGSGPTGLALASDLCRQGISTRLIDSAAGPTTLSKAVVLMPRTLEAFELRGFVDRVLEMGEKIHSFSAYSRGHMIFHTEYAHIGSHYNYLINLPQCDTEAILQEELSRNGGETEWNTQLLALEDNGESVLATIRRSDGSEETVRCEYLVGADGAHSTVRHALNYPFAGSGYADTWLLADVALDWKFRHGRGYSFFGEEGLLAVFPMKNGRHRLYIVQPLAEALGRQPTLEDIRAAVENIAPGLCRISDPGWMSEFRCHHRKVEHYRKGSVFLAGDAAHIHSPETGLGMNTGIQDAYNLAWKLTAVLRGECVPALLDTYDAERSYVGEQVVQLSDFTHRMSSMFGFIGRAIREPLWRFFSRYYSHHYKSVEMGLQTRIHYKPNPFLEHHGRQEDMRDEFYDQSAGFRCLDGEMLTADGGATTTLYHVLGAGKFVLLMFASNLELGDAMRSVVAEVKNRGIKTVAILARQDRAGFEEIDAEIYLDPDVRLHYKFGAQQGALYLVRPDGYIGFSSQPIQPESCASYLQKLFVS